MEIALGRRCKGRLVSRAEDREGDEPAMIGGGTVGLQDWDQNVGDIIAP